MKKRTYTLHFDTATLAFTAWFTSHAIFNIKFTRSIKIPWFAFLKISLENSTYRVKKMTL